ncbi:MAG TPA: type II toxin-antitoxin system Phd/YefM family antitoxin [Candidatus Dormibacteraeota bacterium]|nr:type II toxin-antitoxin system Phd/YefM family antitoxin [Candidatus Dormibacteraeota bacterium]
MVVNIHEAKTNFSRLVERAEHGEEILIGRAGKPVARLVPYERPSTPRVPGGWEGRVEMAPDFDELPPDLAAAFRGELG